MAELTTPPSYTEEIELPLCNLTDPGLSQLKEQVKQVMIPLLIRIFQLRLEVQQAESPPSRILNYKSTPSLEDLEKQLKQLDQDLALLQVWNQSCRTQIEKVLSETKHTPSPLAPSIQIKHQALPAVQKSFQDTILSGKNPIQSISSNPKKCSWWRKWFPKILK